MDIDSTDDSGETDSAGGATARSDGGPDVDGTGGRVRTDSTVSVESVVGAAREMFETHPTTAFVGALVLLGAAALVVGYGVAVSPVGSAVGVVGSLLTAVALRRQGATARIARFMVIGTVMWLLAAPTAVRVYGWPETGATAGAAALLVPPIAFSVWAVRTATGVTDAE